ncbi:tRNA(m(1)G37)methyltransferase [Lecanora helva]
MSKDSGAADMFRPPVNRTMRKLDRPFFKKTIPTSAARVIEKREIARCRKVLGHDLLKLDRMQAIKTVPGPQGEETKALLLRPEIKPEDQATWSSRLVELVRSSQVEVIPYDLAIDYDYWTYYDIISSILPESVEDELPTGFSVVGHIAHLNLRGPYLPFKKLIAQVLLDKNPNIRTVINKIDEIGEQSEYRTFMFEFLAGQRDTNVEVHEGNCAFRFDYSKVYWNSRLETEHRRLVNKFNPGEAVCDVMAGVGPFAVPAGRKQCFVWANDLNPDSHASLEDAVRRNKVWNFVKTFNQDGREFIRSATKNLLVNDISANIPLKQSRTMRVANPRTTSPVYLRCPKIFSHYVLNLPASAVSFLPAFIGIYAGYSDLLEPGTPKKMPMVHVHCFSTKSDDNKEEERKICKELSEQLDFEICPGDPENEGEAEIWDVRDVAPFKRMFCASFRLPKEVAFREKQGSTKA